MADNNLNSKYRPGREDEQGNHIPDERLAEIHKDRGPADDTEYPPCTKCDGAGETVVMNDKGEPTRGRKTCEHCQGAGVEP